MSGWTKLSAEDGIFLAEVIKTFPPKARESWLAPLLVLFSTTSSSDDTTPCGIRTLAEMSGSTKGTCECLVNHLKKAGFLKDVKTLKSKGGSYQLRRWNRDTNQDTNQDTLSCERPFGRTGVSCERPFGRTHQSTEYSDRAGESPYAPPRPEPIGRADVDAWRRGSGV